MKRHRELRLPAVEIKQSDESFLYSFGVDGKLLPSFASVSRVCRNDSAEIEGYQRPEVVAHIREIKAYIESSAPMMPNALVVAFDSRVKFEGAESLNGNYSRVGHLAIPIDESLSPDELPGWIVDGQQRVAAIRDAKVDSFPVCITAFITDSVEKQRSQFILVNSAKPLPKGLIYELLPSTDGHLPTALRRRRFPAHLLDRLNHDEDSPLKGLIRTPTNSEGQIKDNSILRMLENSLSDGALYRFRDWKTGEGDVDQMLPLLKNFWEAVARVFPEAWGVSSRKSRLIHGAGISAMGFLMDAITDRFRGDEVPTVDAYVEDMSPLREVCKWTSGYWEFGPGLQHKWNELQNTSRDIQLLSNYLLWEYKRRVWDRVVASSS